MTANPIELGPSRMTTKSILPTQTNRLTCSSWHQSLSYLSSSNKAHWHFTLQVARSTSLAYLYSLIPRRCYKHQTDSLASKANHRASRSAFALAFHLCSASAAVN